MMRCPKCGGKSWKRTKEESLNTQSESSWTVDEENMGLQVEKKKLNNQETNSKDTMMKKSQETIVNNSQETMMNNNQETMMKNSKGTFVKNSQEKLFKNSQGTLMKNGHGLMETTEGSSVKISQDQARKSCLMTSSQGTTVIKKLGIFEAWKLPLGPWMAPLGAWRQPVSG